MMKLVSVFDTGQFLGLVIFGKVVVWGTQFKVIKKCVWTSVQLCLTCKMYIFKYS